MAGVCVSGYFLWHTNSELQQQKANMELTVPMVSLSAQFPTATLEGVTTLEKVYVAQVKIEGGSSHLLVYLAGHWIDLGEGQITNATGSTATGQ